MRCELGRQCNLRLQFNRQRYVNVWQASEQFSEELKLLLDREPQLEWDDEKQRLVFHNYIKEDRGGRWALFTHERLRSLMKDVSDPGLNYRLNALYRTSHSLDVRQADPHFESRFPAGLLVRGRITHLGEASLGGQLNGRYGKMQLDSGITATIAADEFRHGCGFYEGQLQNALVLSADTDRQQVRVTLRDEDVTPEMLQDECIRSFAAQLGMITIRNDGTDRLTMNHLTEQEIAKLPHRITTTEEMKWMAWAPSLDRIRRHPLDHHTRAQVAADQSQQPQVVNLAV